MTNYTLIGAVSVTWFISKFWGPSYFWKEWS